MDTPTPHRKFLPQQERIRDLEARSPRFRRIYSEYETMSEELRKLEGAEGEPISDDFLNCVRLQTDYLEEEIEDWLAGTEDEL